MDVGGAFCFASLLYHFFHQKLELFFNTTIADIHPFQKYVLKAYKAQGTVFDTGDSAVNQEDLLIDITS